MLENSVKQSHSINCYDRRRVGFSAFRTGTPQTREDVQRLYRHSNNYDSPYRNSARKTLKHWGFNYLRKNCLLSQSMDALLVDALGKGEVYPSVDYRDRMHGLVIFLHRVMFTTLDLVIKTTAVRRTLDERLKFVGQHGFVVNNHVVKPQRTIFSDIGMTATDKTWLLFQLSHVFGWDPQDSLFGGEREVVHAMTSAIAQVQLMLLAVMGRRSYTKPELHLIFDRGYVAFFTAIEKVRELHYNKLLRESVEESGPEPKRFKRQQRPSSGTDTDDTDLDEAVGGFGYYSHSTHALTHQHWVDQVVTAGGFNVHCTQAAESSHKINMHRASVRVRHRECNQTQDSMLNYLCWDSVFEDISKMLPQKVKKRKRVVVGVHNTFYPTVHVTTGVYKQHFQRSILHSEARVSGVELLDLLCEQFSLPKTMVSYMKLNRLCYKFGQKFVREDEQVFWATDSGYSLGKSSRCHRRDFFHLQGLHNGNALCCEAVCFLEITNAITVGASVDKLNFFLVRWLEPHPRSWEHDSLGRPLCPGPLRLNNCLWRYAKTTRPRRSMIQPTGEVSRAFDDYRHLFGETPTKQRERWTREKCAYYGLVVPENILDTMYMCNTFVDNTSRPDPDNWLQTVNMC